uniref:VWFA domain-containing protein n=1 Tax=Pyrodinium bahamense TaxID=73915 RepID=A0A7S0AAC3_9DINO
MPGGVGRCSPLGPGRWLLEVPMPALRDVGALALRTAFHFCLDNSFSMGRSSAEARDCFAQLAAHATEPRSLTAFANRAEVLGSSLMGPAAIRGLLLPPQGQTDISSGVQQSMELIVGREAAEPGAVHHVLFLLSDGQHNVGPGPAQTFSKLARRVRSQAPQLRLSMVVIGISASSKTCDGMLGRAELEIVPLYGLEPIYFADSARDMCDVLRALEVGIRSLAGGRVVRLGLPAAAAREGFVRVPGEEPAHSLEAFGSQDSNLSVAVRADTAPRALLLDGEEVALAESSLECATALAVIQSLIGALRERRIGSLSFNGQAAFDFLDPCIRTVADFQEACQVRSLEASTTGPAARLQRHKAMSAAQHDTRRLRNQLQEALAFHSNDSAEQARFLTGAGKKYGAQALRRAAAAGAGAGGFDALVEAVASTARRLRPALRRDLLRCAARLPPRKRASVAAALSSKGWSAGDLREVLRHPEAADAEACSSGAASLLDDGALVEALRKVGGSLAAPVSYLSLLSQWEQLAEWVAHAEDPAQVRAAGVTTEYELLMYVGMLGFPIKVGRGAATQMDPFQMSISTVKAAPADTVSLCAALQAEQTVSAPEGGNVADLLLLVDPDCPEASHEALKCRLFDMYVSVVLCRDLHMYAGLPMRIALHAHALAAVVGSEAPVEAELDIALHVCYSVRMVWQDFPDHRQNYDVLLGRLRDWEELTAADGVSEPAQLVLALVALCDEDGAEHALAPPAALMMVNETLSRRARHRFKSKAGGEEHMAKIMAAQCVRGFLGITDNSAPEAREMDEPEPPRPVVESACRRDVILDSSTFGFVPWVQEAAAPVLRALGFAASLREALVLRGGGWPRLEADMEAGRGAYADVLQRLHSHKAVVDLSRACDFDAGALERTCAAMAAQAMLCSCSSDRRNLPDVREADTLSQIAVRLRMDTYAGRVAAKLQDWRAVALDVTSARARAADIGQFSSMLGSHAHGLTKGAFWSLWEAARSDGFGGEKVRAFLERANNCFANKYGSPDCAVNRGR